jgi:hypothetical protein
MRFYREILKLCNPKYWKIVDKWKYKWSKKNFLSLWKHMKTQDYLGLLDSENSKLF